MRGSAQRRSTEDRSPGRTRMRCGTIRRPGESWSGAGRSRVLVSPRAQGVPEGSQLPSRPTRGQSRRWRRGPSSGSSEADSAFPWRPRACLGFKCVCQNSTRIEVQRPPIRRVHRPFAVPRYRFSLDFVGAFFGSEDAYATPRLTHVRRATSVWYPDCATRSHPADGPRLPLRSNGFAPGSWSNVSVWPGSTRTIRSSPCTPTAMLPPRRKAMPPNICFSTTPDRPASSFRTRAACASEYVIDPARLCQLMKLGDDFPKSIRDRGHLQDELVARQLADHEIGDIGPGDPIAASRDALGHNAISAGPWPIRQDHGPHGNPVQIPCAEFFEHGSVLPIHAGQEGAGQDQTEAANERSCRFVKRTRSREDDDASDPMLLHGGEDVTNSLREDLRSPSPCGGSEGDEDGLLISGRPVD